MNRHYLLAAAAIMAGCGGYTGDRPADINTPLNGMGANGNPYGTRAVTPLNLKEATFYVFKDGKTPELRAVTKDGVADSVLATIPAEIPAVAPEVKGTYVFAAKSKATEPYSIYRAPAISTSGATELAPGAFASVSQIAVTRDGNTVFVLGTVKDEALTLYKLPKGIRAPIAVAPAEAFAINPKGDVALLVRKGKLFSASIPTLKVTPFGKKQIEGVDPAFSPNGKKVVFAKVADGKYDLYLADKDGNGVSRLTKASDLDKRNPVFTFDAKRVVYSTVEKGKTSVFVVPIDGKTTAVAVRTQPTPSPIAGLASSTSPVTAQTAPVPTPAAAGSVATGQ